VQEGLRVILRQGTLGTDSALTPEEYDKLAEAFGDDMRQKTTLLQRAWDIEHQLDTLVDAAPQLGTTQAQADLPDALRVLEVSRENENIDNKYFTTLLFQLLARRFRVERKAQSGPRVFVVVGADRLGRRDLEDLARFADGKAIRLVYLFERLQDDARSLLGVGGGCGVFMKLVPFAGNLSARRDKLSR